MFSQARVILSTQREGGGLCDRDPPPEQRPLPGTDNPGENKKTTLGERPHPMFGHLPQRALPILLEYIRVLRKECRGWCLWHLPWSHR